jgi:predicted Zn-dependent protease with MMP-like domain
MTESERERFDALVEDVIDGVPGCLRALLDEVSLVVLDRPTPEMVRQLKKDGTLEEDFGERDEDFTDLCGLHTGTAITERSVQDHGFLPDQIHLFREGIVALALEESGLHREDPGADDEIYEEIRVTLLHEIGHHLGLDEDDLEDLGYA